MDSKKFVLRRKIRFSNSRFGIRNRANRAFRNRERKIETNTVGQLIEFLKRFPKDQFVYIEDGYADSIFPIRFGIVDNMNRIIFNKHDDFIKMEYYYNKDYNKKFAFGSECSWKRPPLVDNGFRK
jgi:hypothetical protein